jgi:hypothetical protein
MKLEASTLATLIFLGCMIVITLAVGSMAWGWFS